MSEPTKDTDQPEKTSPRTERILRYISGLSGARSQTATVEGSSSRSGGYPGYGTASDTAEVLATFRETLARLGSEVEEMIREVTGSVGGYERWEADRDALNTYFSLWRDHLSDLEDEGIPPDDPDATELGISLRSHEIRQGTRTLRNLMGHFVEAMRGDKEEAEALREHLEQMDHESEPHPQPEIPQQSGGMFNWFTNASHQEIVDFLLDLGNSTNSSDMDQQRAILVEEITAPDENGYARNLSEEALDYYRVAVESLYTAIQSQSQGPDTASDETSYG
ncbi:hypothetical protein EHS25_008885 [Saitozyma podzolica]|uniref:Uncharacterized protein n=1 Tax=Saitozyma podzolica TaxID=1890683 RepID=A0A427YN40_9TREE|nr:hypothetical protein EHS25_008885 [Saitozyma podzolica]